ncbi:TMEM9 protein [Ancylostoma caninum]|uniref:TMEM9 protein n=1 Tax=Ancylostoma caninum TaxID=29170 RepID=A0A368GKK4_ANCCA|nr:TMEM9 protein [Ancylostoma caninum]
MDAFLANCDCRFESRNTVMLKVVVIFVICVIMLLVTYMAFLLCLDPVLRKQRFQSSYRQQNDEMEDNIFARASESSSAESTIPTNMRTRSGNVLGRVEAEQNRWMKKVEEQRKNIFEDHTMLN